MFAADRVTKSLIVANLPLDSRVTLIDHLLWITHVENSGAAFSISIFGPYVFMAMAAVAASALVYWQVRNRVGLAIGIVTGLILGGVVGNGFDRLISGGAVTDMIEVPYWPVFNVADSALTIGVVVILLGSLRRSDTT